MEVGLNKREGRWWEEAVKVGARGVGTARLGLLPGHREPLGSLSVWAMLKCASCRGGGMRPWLDPREEQDLNRVARRVGEGRDTLGEGNSAVPLQST